jgi:hypothetical protein
MIPLFKANYLEFAIDDQGRLSQRAFLTDGEWDLATPDDIPTLAKNEIISALVSEVAKRMTINGIAYAEVELKRVPEKPKSKRKYKCRNHKGSCDGRGEYCLSDVPDNERYTPWS